MAFNDKIVHTHVYYYLFTITINLILNIFDCMTIVMRIIMVKELTTETTAKITKENCIAYIV